eukprot:TRINITY_DN6877_c0_g1_i1.p1 TRINITY_DN6877_c0_g1~~TRINITY_DN6877_c0_g1_i1.p1  ORF type:complete len:189 (+),score=20.93 TRINITY_DN6877_c0_g1_i1:77-568(+)
MQCPYSKTAWKTLLKVADHFKGRIKITFVPYALVGHQQAYDVHRAAEVVARKCGPTEYFDFVSFLFSNQSDFSNPQFKTKSPLDLLRLLGNWTSVRYDIPLEDLATLMDDDATFDTVKSCQRRGISQGVWCTPTVFLNGALLTRVTGGDAVSTWIEYLSPFIE